ncbi:conserved hypothetical protein [Candidatus Roizmanbacteria bacterium]|nr:conserved hypothetical protein [Candidatus Roizmanbacteria bacterium]
MIITKNTFYTEEEIEKLSELFDIYIKTVIDIKRKVCSAGCDRHFDSEKILLDQGSKQENLWGGGIDLETKIIDCNSMINIRPQQGNTSNEIQDKTRRQEFEKLTKYFFENFI